MAKRPHHHVANYDDESSNAGQKTARRPTVAVADFTEEDYPSDFRWPESYFDLEASSDVAVVVGQTAFLVCRVAVAGNWTVSKPFSNRLHALPVAAPTPVISFQSNLKVAEVK